MKLVIIEDELLTAGDLADTIAVIDPAISIQATLTSVNEGLHYFLNHAAPDLIFSDIRLGDGLCFEIFKKLEIPAPVIFCTAYDEYAIRAFKTNGIDYIVKPFTERSVAEALGKYQKLKAGFSGQPDALTYKSLIRLIERDKTARPASLLVHHKEQIRPVKISEIALFYIDNGMTRLSTFGGRRYFIDKSLDELQELSGPDFFRASRQHLLNRDAVISASPKITRKLEIKLSIPFRETITVSKAKTPDFLEWLGQ